MKILKPINLSLLFTFTFTFTFLFGFFGIVNTCYGQSAKYKQNGAVIEVNMAAAKVESNTVIKVQLSKNSTDVIKTYTAAQIRPAGSGVLRFIFSIDTPVADMPANLAADPVVLLVFHQTGDDANPIGVKAITVRPGEVQTTYQAMYDSLQLELAKAKGKEDAELYLSGEFSTAVKSKPNWTADIKYEREFGKRGFPFLVAPFFNLRYNNKVKNDTDKVSFGVRFSNSFGFSAGDSKVKEDEDLNNILNSRKDQIDTPKYTKIRRSREQREYFLYKGSLEFESDWDFRVNNLITSQEIQYLVKPLFFPGNDSKVNGKLIFTPFVGAELGRNLKNPTNRKDLAIMRLKAGATLTLNLDEPIKGFFVKNVVWENKFTRRFFLANEIAYEKNDADELLEKAFGKKPRTHFMSTFEFKFNDFFGPTISYEWGEVPPLYNKVNHKVKIGLTYSFKRKPLP